MSDAGDALRKRLRPTVERHREAEELLRSPLVRSVLEQRLVRGLTTPDIELRHKGHATGLAIRFRRSGGEFQLDWRVRDEVADVPSYTHTGPEFPLGGTLKMRCASCKEPANDRTALWLIQRAIVALSQNKPRGGSYIVQI